MYITLTKEDFENFLPTGWQEQEVNGCKEIVYRIPTIRESLSVRIYSTVDQRTGKTRGKGEDAIRVVYWDDINDRPVGKGKKILRVEGKTTVPERIASRVKNFIEKSTEVSLVDFNYVRAILSHPAISWMGFADSLLDGLNKYGSLTDNQLAYVLGKENPKGKPTMEARVLSKDPTFADTWKEIEYETDDPGDDEAVSEMPEETLPLPETAEPEGRKAIPGQVPEKKNSMVPDCIYTTKDYQYFRYPFEEFNPVQSLVMPHREEDVNLVIGANTSAGKTICAELIMDHILLRKTRNRVVYLSPLKSLTQEKYDDWQKRFPEEEITILTGDYTLSERMKKKLSKSKIIVMTSEMCDSRTRKFRSEKNYWLKEVGLIIVDESHILSTSRGHAVECGLMRFSKINPHARIVLLSATMPNVDELGRWCPVLNGKNTEVIFSTWRPVELQFSYYEYQVTQNSFGREDYWASQERKRVMAVDIVMSKPDEKFLVFVHDKATGRNIVSRLKEVGQKAVFHNADLELKERKEIEASFKDRENGLRVLVSTSTTAWGVNLPARNVVIVGYHRGLSEVDELDIIQMAGRAGRYGIDDEGFVHMILPQGTVETWREKFKNPRPVTSILNEPSILAFHMLSEIATRSIDSVAAAERWYERSLSAMQELEPFTKETIENLFSDLEQMQMITFSGIRPTITELGRVSANLYYSPYDIYAWFKNFSTIKEIGDESDLAISWAFGNIPSNDWGYVPKDIQGVCDDYSYRLRAKLNVNVGGAVKDCLATYKALTGEKPEGLLATIHRGLVFDCSRMVQAIRMIDRRYAKWGFDELFGILDSRIKYCVGNEAVVFTKLKGIGGVKAKKLYNLGFRSLGDIANPKNRRLLAKMFPPHKIKTIQHQAKGLLE